MIQRKPILNDHVWWWTTLGLSKNHTAHTAHPGAQVCLVPVEWAEHGLGTCWEGEWQYGAMPNGKGERQELNCFTKTHVTRSVSSTYIHSCMHACIHTYVRTYIHRCICIHIWQITIAVYLYRYIRYTSYMNNWITRSIRIWYSIMVISIYDIICIQYLHSYIYIYHIILDTIFFHDYIHIWYIIYIQVYNIWNHIHRYYTYNIKYDIRSICDNFDNMIYLIYL